MKRLLIAALLLAGGAAALAQQGAPAPGAGAQGQPAAPPAQGGPPPAPKPITLASRPGATGGEALYIEHCMHCHGPNGMGTGLLARRPQPRIPLSPLLEARAGLTAQYVILAVRNGIGNMPPVPRGEVSDEELKQIADYLAAGPHEAAR